MALVVPKDVSSTQALFFSHKCQHMQGVCHFERSREVFKTTSQKKVLTPPLSEGKASLFVLHFFKFPSSVFQWDWRHGRSFWFPVETQERR